jgi:hypothetical protein
LKPKIHAHPQILSPSPLSHPKEKDIVAEIPFNSTANNLQIENRKKGKPKIYAIYFKIS